MSELKVGDRVRIYAVNLPPTKAEVISVSKVDKDNEYVTVLPDGYECSSTFHRKQLRKLVKRKRRVVYGLERFDGLFEKVSEDLKDLEFGFKLRPDLYKRIVRFVEVKE